MNPLSVYTDQYGNKLPLVQVSNYRCPYTLAANTRQAVTHPTSPAPKYVLITVNCETWVIDGDTLAVPVADVTDGTGPTLIPANNSRLFKINPDALTMSLISTAGGLVCLEYYQ